MGHSLKTHAANENMFSGTVSYQNFKMFLHKNEIVNHLEVTVLYGFPISLFPHFESPHYTLDCINIIIV